MPGYAKKALEHFKHKLFSQTDTPSKHIVRYGKASQKLLKPPPLETELSDEDNIFIQRVVGTFFYYGHAVNPTVLHALSPIVKSRTYRMKQCLDSTTHLLNYLATHPNAVLRYHALDMVLFVHSDALYMTESKAQTQVGGHFFLSLAKSDPNKPPSIKPVLNRPILSE